MSNSFLSIVWDVILTFITNLPWVAMAMMAAIAFMRRKEAKMLLLQAAGAAAMFILGIGQVFLIHLLVWLNVTYEIRRAESVICSFLMFIALCTFALGYCIERIAKRKEPQGFPVQP